jgi:pyruvate/2-oxoglutarate dehydrogenase complex dihydrolipoamide acyltransferase (E2) component
MTADTTHLLELLREAGDEAVTLDELAIVGVRDPAGALRALEAAGHAVQRVPERPRRGWPVTCVRLARAAPERPAVAPPPTVAPPPAAPPPAALAHARRGLLAATALGVLLLVVVRALSGRRA